MLCIKSATPFFSKLHQLTVPYTLRTTLSCSSLPSAKKWTAYHLRSLGLRMCWIGCSFFRWCYPWATIEPCHCKPISFLFVNGLSVLCFASCSTRNKQQRRVYHFSLISDETENDQTNVKVPVYITKLGRRISNGCTLVRLAIFERFKRCFEPSHK